jgi:hypothetical protein
MDNPSKIHSAFRSGKLGSSIEQSRRYRYHEIMLPFVPSKDTGRLRSAHAGERLPVIRFVENPGRANKQSPKRDRHRFGRRDVDVTTAVSTGPGTMLA